MTASGSRRVAGHSWSTLVSLLVAGLISTAGALWAVPSPQQSSQPAGAQAAPASAQQDQSKKAADKKDAQASQPRVPESSRRVYSVRNGTDVYYRSEETDVKPTKDGQVETRTIREPSYNGDNRVLQQQQVTTKNLPDGTVEK
ncbi:MAG TPA: hypothetical protein VJV74_00855, partial [Terriglobia bacterium]|nr:hypothetical protein [Terriglobia bacterium]